MAAEHFATFTRWDDRKIVVRKSAVVAFERAGDNESTHLYLDGRNDPLKIEETAGQVARAIGAV